MATQFHATVEELELYALDRLADAGLARLEEHLIGCATCLQCFDEIEACAAGMREALMEGDEHSGWDLLGWLRRPAVSMFLGFVILLTVMALFSRRPVALAPSAALQIPTAGSGMPIAPPTRELNITIHDALPDSGPFRVEVVTRAGKTVWSSLATASAQGIEIKMQWSMTAGDYVLRLYAISGQKLKDYAFRIG